MKNRPQAYIIRSPQQLSVLAAAARQEVLDVLAEMGTVSAAEIGAALGRPTDALYFHLRALTKARLVEHVGDRIRGKRREALYRTVAPELRLQYQPRNVANRRGVSAIVSSMLRLGVRDFRSAFQRTDVVVSGKRRELWALRRTGRLLPQDIENLNRAIGHLRGEMKPRGRGRLYALTVLLTPIDRSRTGTGSITKSKPAKNK